MQAEHTLGQRERMERHDEANWRFSQVWECSNKVLSINTLATYTMYQYLHKRFVCHPHAIKQALPNPHEIIIRKLCKTIINHQYVQTKYSKPNGNTLHSPTIKFLAHIPHLPWERTFSHLASLFTPLSRRVLLFPANIFANAISCATRTPFPRAPSTTSTFSTAMSQTWLLRVVASTDHRSDHLAHRLLHLA